jgi:hypothetical protein
LCLGRPIGGNQAAVRAANCKDEQCDDPQPCAVHMEMIFSSVHEQVGDHQQCLLAMG